MKTCEYEYWNKKNKCIQRCGHEAKELKLPNSSSRLRRTSIFLCEEHREFVIDAIDKYSEQKTKAEMKAETKLELF